MKERTKKKKINYRPNYPMYKLREFYTTVLKTNELFEIWFYLFSCCCFFSFLFFLFCSSTRTFEHTVFISNINTRYCLSWERYSGSSKVARLLDRKYQWPFFLVACLPIGSKMKRGGNNNTSTSKKKRRKKKDKKKDGRRIVQWKNGDEEVHKDLSRLSPANTLIPWLYQSETSRELSARLLCLIATLVVLFRCLLFETQASLSIHSRQIDRGLINIYN